MLQRSKLQNLSFFEGFYKHLHPVSNPDSDLAKVSDPYGSGSGSATLIVPDIEQFEQMISAGCEQPVAVLVPLAVHHRVLVRVNRRQDLNKR
jgi:hypothetical protein